MIQVIDIHHSYLHTSSSPPANAPSDGAMRVSIYDIIKVSMMPKGGPFLQKLGSSEKIAYVINVQM